MSDRAIPRSYATMQGLAYTASGWSMRRQIRILQLSLEPKAGTHSRVWDEAVKISGADPDFHRRDLRGRIASGAYPEWEFGVQALTEEQAEQFSFDILDATKLIPEELVPVQNAGIQNNSANVRHRAPQQRVRARAVGRLCGP